MKWCADVLMCWCVDVLMCWCVCVCVLPTHSLPKTTFVDSCLWLPKQPRQLGQTSWYGTSIHGQHTTKRHAIALLCLQKGHHLQWQQQPGVFAITSPTELQWQIGPPCQHREHFSSPGAIIQLVRAHYCLQVFQSRPHNLQHKTTGYSHYDINSSMLCVILGYRREAVTSTTACRAQLNSVALAEYM